MAETAEQVHARIVEVTGAHGRLAAPPSNAWDNFPWEAVDGAVVPRLLPPPADEPARAGVIGSPVIEWDDVLPPGSEEVWRADLHTIATKLANWGGGARV